MNDLRTEKKKRGRPKTDNPKVHISLRLDPDVLQAYKDEGVGWQTQINSDLRKMKNL